MFNRFDLINQEIENGNYVELDELSLAMTNLCKSIAKCKNPTQDTFKFIDQLLLKCGCHVDEIFEEALHEKNRQVIKYLATLYKKYQVINDQESNDKNIIPCYLNASFLTSEHIDTTITLLDHIIEHIMNYSSFNSMNDLEFIKYLLTNNIFKLNDFVTLLLDLDLNHDATLMNTIIYLYDLMTVNELTTKKIDRIIINYIIKCGTLENLEALLIIVPDTKILDNMKISNFFNVFDRPSETTNKLFNRFENYKVTNFEYVRKDINEQIINGCHGCHGDRSFEGTKILLELTNYDQNYLKLLLLFSFCNNCSIKSFSFCNDCSVELIKHLFDLSNINPASFVNQILYNDPCIKNIFEDSIFRAMFDTISMHRIWSTRIPTCNINYYTLLEFCKYFELEIDYALLYRNIPSNDWKNTCSFISQHLKKNDDNAKIYNELFSYIKSDESYQNMFEPFYTRKWLNLDLVTRYNIFKIESTNTDFVLKIAEFYISKARYRDFMKFIKIYPEIEESNLNDLYNKFIHRYDNLDKIKEDTHDMSIRKIKNDITDFLKYFDSKGIDIGLNFYHIIKNNFCQVFNKYAHKYGFDIHDKKVYDIFTSLCCNENNDILAFIEYYPNYDHLITENSIVNSGYFESSNRLKYFLNRIINHNIILDTNEMFQYIYDMNEKNENILEEVARASEKNKERLAIKENSNN